MNRKGFTLIELLVVIAIIAILAAILFPVFARARENARKSTCQSNLKQLSLGLIQYRQDYDERNIMDRMDTPVAPTATGPYNRNGVNRFWWFDNLQPYVKNRQVIKCPSDAGTTSCCGFPDRSYQPNTEMCQSPGIAEPLVQDPAGTIHLIESKLNSRAHYTDAGSYINQKFHFDGWNIAYADGHVKWIRQVPNGQFTLVAGD